jgi:mono/diheme cytochrome c family protein
MNRTRARQAAIVLAGLFILLVAACGDQTPTPVGDPARGAALWAQSPCIGCHGLSAEGAAGGPALAATPLTLSDVTGIVRRGGPGMPKYGADQFGDQDLQDLYAWFQNPVPAATAAPGESPWPLSGCAGCHGQSAEGGTGPALSGTAQPFAAFQAAVRQGRGSMPSFSAAQIGDQALQALYASLTAQPAVPQTPWVQSGCAGCHGAGARGGSAEGLAGWGLSFDRLQQVVRGGEDAMPAYSTAQLSDADLQAIYDWLMALP